LSADGQYVVVGRLGSVRFYGRGSSTPLWIHLDETDFTSVAISADGSYVAAGGYVPGEGRVFFFANAKSLTGDPAWTWRSESLNGPLEHRCLVISADGNTVAACGTGPNVFYWAGATGKSGSDVPTTWRYMLEGNVEAIAVSDDGSHVAAVGELYVDGAEGVLVYWNNAGSLTKNGIPGQEPTWSGQELGERFVDVAISDDGNYVAVAGEGAGPSTVYYWAGALTRTGMSEPHTWAGGVDVIFSSVDMSCDGDSVVAGSGGRFVEGGSHSVYFWGGARSLTGGPSPTWVYHTDYPVWDVAINDAGTYMAAVDFPIDTVYFFNRQGNLLWQDQAISGDKLSISCDGGTLAVGTPEFGTAYLFATGFSSPCCGEVEPVGGVVMSPGPMSGFLALLPWLLLAAVAVGAGAYAMRKRYASPLLARIK
jgi:WD40 repeat protein